MSAAKTSSRSTGASCEAAVSNESRNIAVLAIAANHLRHSHWNMIVLSVTSQQAETCSLSHSFLEER